MTRRKAMTRRKGHEREAGFKQTLLYRHRALAGILLLAFLLRVPGLGVLPPIFVSDEAINAYDAWSLLKTGYDHHGAFLPLFFEGNGDWREGLYIWLMAPFLAVFGLEEGAARLPAALIGTANVAVLYALTRQLFGRKVALMAALLLAVSPWHLHYSRLAWRVITWPFFFCLALWSFLRAVKENRPRLLSLAAVLFAAGMYTYSAVRLFAPPFLAALVWLYRRPLAAFPRHWLLAACFLFLVLFLPQLLFWLSARGLARLDVGYDIHLSHLNPVELAPLWLSYYGPDFLFVVSSGLDPSLPLPGYGVLHALQLALAPLGLVFLFRERDAAARKLLLLWLALYPVAGVLTFEAHPHPTRALIAAPLFAILSSLGLTRGLQWLFRTFGEACSRLAAIALAGAIATVATVYISSQIAGAYAYPRTSPVENYWSVTAESAGREGRVTTRIPVDHWLFGLKNTIAWLRAGPYADSYDCIRISDEYRGFHALHVPDYVRFLMRLPPRLWLEEKRLGRYVVGALPGGRSASDIRNTTLAARSRAAEAGATGSGAARNACLLVTFTYEEYEALRGGDYASRLVHTVRTADFEATAWLIEVFDEEGHERERSVAPP